MKSLSKLFLLILAATLMTFKIPSAGAEDTVNSNITGLSGFTRKLEPDKLLTSGGIRVKSGGDVTLEPEFGVSHVAHHREVGSGYDDITHKVHAQAGGKVNLTDKFYLGFATKLPIYNYEATEGRTPGGAATPSTPGKHDYEIMRLSPENLTWTGELGVHLRQRIDLNLYYDQNILKGPLQPGIKSEEEVFGTRFIMRFK